ncbi:metalloprotease [Flavobacterium humi]|uniref:Metalloprotease n=1 Tax=Flavobacterium humi TaxID=2562683 RepID=A0A4Z0LB45_9FLAO|nr:metalloprotease [Flavobacterium humi]TGD58928.1 metalloprotease [Flavobacterium humi]
MKTIKKTSLIMSAMALGMLFACSKDDSAETETSKEAISQPSALNKECSYVDAYWSSNAYLNSTIINTTQTNFIYAQNTKIASVFGQAAVTLRIVHDDSNPNSTYNAISYSYPKKIYFGEAIYRAALAKGQIVPAMILAHEFGHQLQYAYGLPSVSESTARPNELEADGFAGYYMRKPSGYNATWAAAGPAFEFAYAIGDYSTSNPGHHGTPPQRRSATRLGWYLGEYNLSASAFDSNFFYYYNNVLSGSYRGARPSTVTDEMDAFINSKMEELRKINSGEIDGTEFGKLND